MKCQSSGEIVAQDLSGPVARKRSQMAVINDRFYDDWQSASHNQLFGRGRPLLANIVDLFNLPTNNGLVSLENLSCFCPLGLFILEEVNTWLCWDAIELVFE
jgi:hypothetical protein